MRLESLRCLNSARRKRRAAVLLTDLEGSDEQLFLEGDPLEGPYADPVDRAFRSGRSMAFDREDRKVFLNVHLPSPRIAVIGAVHISQFLAPMARLAGFDVRIVDPRTAFAAGSRFPDVPISGVWPVEAFEIDALDRYTALVALTHDSKIDDFPVVEALRTGCFYVGALGSRKTHARRCERLAAQGVGGDALATIHAPIGLDIRASTPAEIAVAILAEIILAWQSGRLLSPPDGSP